MYSTNFFFLVQYQQYFIAYQGDNDIIITDKHKMTSIYCLGRGGRVRGFGGSHGYCRVSPKIEPMTTLKSKL